MTPDDCARIAPWLQPVDVLLDAQVGDGPNAIDVLASAVARVQGMESAPLFRALMRREQAGSTGLGNGFAIPHARIGGIERPITLFMRTQPAIPFHAPDGKPVSLLLAILTPSEGVKEDHLILLALVAELFSNNAFRDTLQHTLDPLAAAGAFRAAITQLVGTSVAIAQESEAPVKLRQSQAEYVASRASLALKPGARWYVCRRCQTSFGKGAGKPDLAQTGLGRCNQCLGEQST